MNHASVSSERTSIFFASDEKHAQKKQIKRFFAVWFCFRKPCLWNLGTQPQAVSTGAPFVSDFGKTWVKGKKLTRLDAVLWTRKGTLLQYNRDMQTFTLGDLRLGSSNLLCHFPSLLRAAFFLPQNNSAERSKKASARDSSESSVRSYIKIFQNCGLQSGFGFEWLRSHGKTCTRLQWELDLSLTRLKAHSGRAKLKDAVGRVSIFTIISTTSWCQPNLREI